MLATASTRSSPSAAPHVTRHRTPARRGYASAKVDEPTLLQFIVLSMLLHVLAVVLFGDAGRGGGVRRGDALPGTLEVTLERLSPETVPPLDPNAPEEADKPLRPKAVAPAPIEPAPQRIEPIVAPQIERELLAPVEAPTAALPTVPAVPLERIAPAPIEHELTAPAELAPREVPTVPSVPLERITPRQLERELASPAELPPRVVPAAPSAPIERVTPPPLERDIAPPVAVPAPRQAPLPVVEPERGGAPSAAPSSPIPPAEAAPRAPATIAPQTAPVRPAASPLPRQGAPEANEDIFKPRGDRPSPEPGPAPRIDLDAAKKRAVREMAHEGSGSRGVLPFPLPVPPEKKSKDANALEKAIKPDCRTAYAGMGLLAVPALLAAAITDEGCRW